MTTKTIHISPKNHKKLKKLAVMKSGSIKDIADQILAEALDQKKDGDKKE
jgi:hypothetical protein